MSSPTAFEFADLGGAIRCWVGKGVPGIGDDEHLVVLEEEGEFSAARATHDIPEIEVAAAETGAPFSSGPARLSFERNGEMHEFEGVGAVSTPPAGTDAALVRSLVALDGEEAASLALYSERPAGAEHDAERAVAWLLEPGAEPRPVDEPLLSTEYAETGIATRVGLELWVGEGDEVPLRGAGTKVVGATIDLDGWQLDAGFYRWVIEGAEGEGSYLIWRR